MTDRAQRTQATLPAIVELGKQGGNFVPKELPSGETFGALWDQWDQILSGWSTEDILHLAKGMVYFERLNRVNYFGSVAPTPRIFSVYAGRVAKEDSDLLADWILANTVNEYCPFGTNNHGAKSLEQLECKLRQIELRKAETRQRESAREQEAKVRRAQEASLRLPRAIERNDVSAVAALIAKGADPDYSLPDGRSARQIAKELGRVELLTSSNPDERG